MHIVLFSSQAWPLPAATFEAQHQVTALHGALSDLQTRVVASKPDLVLLGGFEQNDVLLEKMESLCAALPHAAVLLVCTNPESAFLMRAMRAGVREVISSEAPEAITTAVTRAQAKFHSSRQNGAITSRCIGFMPAKGGDGATCVVANLAAQLSQTPSLRVLLIDLSLPFGDVELYLTRDTGMHNLADFADEIERLDGALLEGMASHITSNFHLIQSPQTIDQLMHITPSYVDRLIRIAIQHYDYVLLDLQLDTISLSVLELLDQLVVVTTMNVPSVRHASQILRMWESLGYAAAKLSIVVNAFHSQSIVRIADFEKTVGRRIGRVLPLETDGVETSLLKGIAAVLLKPKSDFSKTINAWAAELTGRTPTEKSLWQHFGIK
jgi:pilus assembly protein CpaE